VSKVFNTKQYRAFVLKTAYMVRHEKTYTEYTIRNYTQSTKVKILIDCKVFPKRSYV